METIITAFFEEVLKLRIYDTIELFKKCGIKVVNMKIDYTKNPIECVIKTEDKE